MMNSHALASGRSVIRDQLSRTPNRTRTVLLVQLAVVALLASLACSGQEPTGRGADPGFIPASDTTPPTIAIDTGTRHQTISG